MIWLLLTPAGLAYTCAILEPWEEPYLPPPHRLCPDASPPDCYTWDMSTMGDIEYRFNENDFTNAQMDEIELAADAWEGGWSKVNRGVWLELSRTQGAGDGALDNGVNNVRMKSRAHFNQQGFAGDAYVWIYVDSTCDHITEFDVTFATDAPWTTNLPSELNGEEKSLGQVSVHEFGHGLGIGDDGSQLHVMDPKAPTNGGDIAGTRYRVHEEDFYALRYLYPGFSTGGNVMLSKFGGFSPAEERWNVEELQGPFGRTWAACPGDVLSGGANGGPLPIYALVTGHIGFAATPVIRWMLDPDQLCLLDGDEVTVGTRTPTMGVHYPYEVFPNGGYAIPTGTPAGDYRLCARINDDYAMVETSYIDNIVSSEAIFEVLTCP